ncbi:hypothetical protein [Celeribacter naphthalenivorans]|uniref:hypothetical protein n=1 Tax=Celeribacter naphthalenivorans TaxID=1614694 RepID=UPI001CFB792E|nr:hypothetical protein [Celeribacter naphthalenivorans]
MASYVYRDGRMVDKETGEPMLSDEERGRTPAVPMVMGFKPYSCPITGKEIRTLGQHNENLKRHNCVEAAELKSPTGGEIRNERFAKKHGLTVSEKYKDQPWKPRTRADG